MKSIHCLQSGSLVRSCAGHDKGSLMVVLAADESFVYVADGKHRMVEKPKRKKPKHLELIGVTELCHSSGAPVSNAALRKLLRSCRDQ